MASKIVGIFLLILLPSLVLAEDSDYLFVNFDYSYADGSVSNMTAEQRVMDSEEVVQLPGDFILSLKDSAQEISRISFSIPPQEAEAGHEAAAPPTTYSKTVAIPIPLSLIAIDSSIEIKKGDQLLASKGLSELDLEILSVKGNFISVPEEKINYPPLPSENNNSWLAYAIGLGLVSIILGIWYWSNKRKQQI